MSSQEAPRVEEIVDNVQASEPAESEAPQDPGFFNIAFVLEATSKHYKREFKNIKMITPAQVVDGSVIEFADDDNTIVAVARVRFRNKLIVNQPDGGLFMVTQLSDLTFSRSVLPLVQQSAEEAAAAEVEAPAATAN